MSGHGQGHEVVKDVEEAVAQVSRANSQQKVKKGVTSLNKTSRKYITQ